MRLHLLAIAVLAFSVWAALVGHDAAAAGPSLLGVSAKLPPAAPRTAAGPGVPATGLPAALGQLRVTFVDGNTGMVLETPAGRTYVIDPGGKTSYERRMAPYLRSRGIRRVDGVLITHPHHDHYEGLRYRDGVRMAGLMEDFQVGEVFDAADVENEDRDGYLKVLGKLGVGPARTTGVRTGQRLAWDPALMVEVLSPPARLFSRAECAARAGYDTVANWTNESSLVVKVTHGEVSLLFTGDIHDLGMAYLIDRAGEVTVKKELVVDGRNLEGKTFPARRNASPILPGDIDVLALPHHGVGRATCEPFRDTVRPRATIAPNDRRQFESDTTQRRVRWWDTPATDLFWSAPEHDGRVTVLSSGAQFQVSGERSGRSATYPGEEYGRCQGVVY